MGAPGRESVFYNHLPMSPRLPPDVLDPRFYDLLGEVPEELFDHTLYWSVELVERYAREWAVELAVTLGLDRALREAGDGGVTAGDTVVRLELPEGLTLTVDWILEQLAAAGLLHAAGLPGDPGGRRFHPGAPADPGTGSGAGELLRAPRRAEVREAALEHDPANEPFLDLLDAAGETVPRMAAGETTGEAALLGASGIGRWARYFSNDNPVYALNNRLAALAAARRLATVLPHLPEAAAEVLEVGAGAGSATEALLRALEERRLLGQVATVRVSEPAALLRRRAERTLPRRFAQARLAFADLDVDRPWAEQGVEQGTVALVYGVNVFHVARDLGFSLSEARRALVPGGWLVIGECLRPRPGQPVAAELPFLLLEGFREVETHPELRPRPGFLTPESWVASLEAAGFEGIEVVPDVRELRELHPRFTTGALCGLRPSA